MVGHLSLVESSLFIRLSEESEAVPAVQVQESSVKILCVRDRAQQRLRFLSRVDGGTLLRRVAILKAGRPLPIQRDLKKTSPGMQVEVTRGDEIPSWFRYLAPRAHRQLRDAKRT